MNFTSLIVLVIASTVVRPFASDAAEPSEKIARVVARAAPPSAQKKLQAIRSMLIERMKASREDLRDALPQYEERLAAQRAEVEAKKKLYEQDLISKLDLENSQQALATAEMDTERVRHWIAEDDRALLLTDRSADAEMTQPRELAPGAYQERGIPWSPALVAKVAKFFKARFGKELPVSAAGQSSTHDRLGYDHREAVDVAVSPQSREGRGLIAYLRQARIPFLAFRGKVPGISTGPHIHIGLPSPRVHLIEAKQHTVEAAESMQSGQGG